MSIKVRRLHDPLRINNIIRHPEIYPSIGDDYRLPPTEFDVTPVVDQFVWLVPYWNNAPMGFAAFQPITRTLFSYHGGIFVSYRGPRGFAAARAMFGYMFHSLEVKKLITMTPADNRPAARFNALVGLKREGLLTAAQMSGGKLVDMILYGITIEEFDDANYSNHFSGDRSRRAGIGQE